MGENYLKKELYQLVKRDSTIFDFVQAGFLDGIWYWDIENPENEWMSERFWETLGYDPKEKKHLAYEWQDIIFKEDLKAATSNFQKHCLDPNHPYDQIVRYRHKNGSTVWVRCRGIAIRDDSGEPIRMLGAHTDITSLKEAEEEIKSISLEYEKVFNGTQDAMFLVEVLDNNTFRYIRTNLTHQSKTKISLEKIRNKTPQELLGKEIGDIISKNYQRCYESRESIVYEEELCLPGGNRVWLTTLTPILEDNRKSYIVGSSTDITDRKELELELQNSAYYDKLTGIPNRRLFFEKLSQMITENKRDSKKFAVLFIDLDGFKAVNDNYGHEVGDKVLATVASRLQNCVRRSDVLSRMGGDEFTVILRNIKDKNAIEAIVNKIHKALKEVMYIDEQECRVDSSIGIAIYPENGKDCDTLLRNADAAMYDIKKNGKGGYSFFSNN
ncbi:diguanylate cyclase [Alkaliphilus pronyensis]|uniref:Diguanylate cyclase n=1 Tax=Alkaliphilus pronyensis TaxID=1482732 RepID=A0A6I0FRY7_9FIRM|nr:sensor domain-containing diguanylate cyclase [Alkaliphilus pronyensis]KAB3539014.1 diguanylate cyclase [Alkaliphilus pronyensis]